MCCQCFDAGAIGGRAGLRACECMLNGLEVLSGVGIVLALAIALAMASSRFGWFESQFRMANLEMPSAILSIFCFDPCSMEAGRKPSPGVPFQNTGSTTSPGGAAGPGWPRPSPVELLWTNAAVHPIPSRLTNG